MILGVDYYPACTHPRGVGRYLRELVRALAAIEGGAELRLLDWGRAKRAIGADQLGIEHPLVPLKRASMPLPRGGLAALTKVGIAADRFVGGCDWFLRAEPGWPPVRRAKTLAPVSELPPPGDERSAGIRAGLERLDRCIVFSAEGERRLTEEFGFSAERVLRLPVGCDHWHRMGEEALPFPSRPAWLVLGGLRADREAMRILEAFEVLHAEGVVSELRWIGPAGDAAEKFVRRVSFCAARKHIRWIDTDEERRMPAHLADTSLLVHLSLDELTPVTPLEALRSGRGAVVSDLPAFRETLGSLVDYAPPAGGRQGKDGLLDALRAGSERALDPELAQARVQLACRYPWAEHARAFLRALDA